MKFFNIKYAIKGIVICLKEESNFRIHLGIALVVSFLGWYFNISSNEWIAQTLCIGLILFAEIVNTAIENLVDLVSPEWNNKAGRVKDIASGAVLTLSFFAFTIGVIIYGSKFLS